MLKVRTVELIYLLTYLFTYSIEQSPSWEADQFSASQEIPRILRQPEVHCRIYKRPPPVPTLSHSWTPIHLANRGKKFKKKYRYVVCPRYARVLDPRTFWVNWTLALSKST